MTRGHNPCRPVHTQSDVTPLANGRLARVDAHTHAFFWSLSLYPHAMLKGAKLPATVTGGRSATQSETPAVLRRLPAFADGGLRGLESIGFDLAAVERLAPASGFG
jgi:hypothetical protein